MTTSSRYTPGLSLSHHSPFANTLVTLETLPAQSDAAKSASAARSNAPVSHATLVDGKQPPMQSLQVHVLPCRSRSVRSYTMPPPATQQAVQCLQSTTHTTFSIPINAPDGLLACQTRLITSLSSASRLLSVQPTSPERSPFTSQMPLPQCPVDISLLSIQPSSVLTPDSWTPAVPDCRDGVGDCNAVLWTRTIARPDFTELENCVGGCPTAVPSTLPWVATIACTGTCPQYTASEVATAAEHAPAVQQDSLRRVGSWPLAADRRKRSAPHWHRKLFSEPQRALADAVLVDIVSVVNARMPACDSGRPIKLGRRFRRTIAGGDVLQP